MKSNTFGRYQIREELGQGGMGDVYLAHDPLMKRDVALKVLSVTVFENDAIRKRFEQEAQLIAKLEHPAIVPIYDFGIDHNRPFYVMKYMPGKALTDKLQWGSLPPRQAIAIFTRICEALSRAHHHKVIHRDLKPANILFDDQDNAYLADFGIAHLVERTQTRSQIGTFHYMAPEQARGLHLDARTDIYQMGIVLFEMLTGQKPFTGKTPHALIMQHNQVPLPSVHAYHDHLLPGYDAVLKRATAKKQSERFDSIDTFLQAVLRVYEAKIETAPLGTQYSINFNHDAVDLHFNTDLLFALGMANNLKKMAGDPAFSLQFAIDALLSHIGFTPDQINECQDWLSGKWNVTLPENHLTAEFGRQLQFLLSQQEPAYVENLINTIDQSIFLQACLSLPICAKAKITVTKLDTICFIREWRLAPHMLLKCVDHMNQEQNQSFMGGHPITQDIQITFQADSGIPVLSLTCPSKPTNSVWEHRRTNWVQRPTPDFDLNLYDVRDNLLGQIMTRKLVLPTCIEGENISLMITETCPITLHQTQMFLHNGDEVATYYTYKIDWRRDHERNIA